MRIGILGGTFNPVHLGHLLLAQSACERCDLDRIWFMPCDRPPHKPALALAPACARVAMLRAAVRGNPRFSVSRIELRRGGISYAVDTLRTLHARFPKNDWFFIAGLDSLLELHCWREVETLLGLCTFVTLHRPGLDLPPGPEALRLPLPLAKRLLENVHPGRNLDVSSSEIRERVASKRSIRYLVPDTVADCIRRRGLYQRP